MMMMLLAPDVSTTQIDSYEDRLSSFLYLLPS